MRYLVAIAAALAFAGCSTFPKNMVGKFDAERDFIVVEEDGFVYWSPHNSPYPQPHFVGGGTADKEDHVRVRITAISIGPCYGSSLRYSPDFSKVKVDWGRCYNDAASSRSTEFERATSK